MPALAHQEDGVQGTEPIVCAEPLVINHALLVAAVLEARLVLVGPDGGKQQNVVSPTMRQDPTSNLVESPGPRSPCRTASCSGLRAFWMAARMAIILGLSVPTDSRVDFQSQRGVFFFLMFTMVAPMRSETDGMSVMKQER